MRTWHLALPLDPDSDLPDYLQIAQGIQVAIREGRLRPGDPLPGSRTLATHLGVCRNSVIAAYQELAAEGCIQTVHGGGSFIAKHAPNPVVHPPAKPGVSEGLPFDLRSAPSTFSARTFGEAILACWTGDSDPRLLPAAALSRAYVRATRNPEVARLGPMDPYGNPRLRAALADMLASTKGLAAQRDTLLVTSGVQDALALLVHALLPPGARVGVEAVGSPAHRSMLQVLGATLVPLAMDGDGLLPDALEQQHREARFQALLVTPLRQYPTNATLPLPRRERLLAWARAKRVPLLELDLDPGIHYEGSPPLPLAATDLGHGVVYVGAFSKLLFPSLPLAYIHGGPTLIQELARWREATHPSGDPFLELALSELLEDGEVLRHLNRLRKVCHERRDALAEAFRKHLAGVLDPTPPTGGLAFWSRSLAPARDLQAWAKRALEGGVAFRPGQEFTFDLQPIPYLRMGFGTLAPRELQDAVRRMVKAL